MNNLILEAPTFAQAITHLRSEMALHGQSVKTETWQGRDIRGKAEAEMFELLNVHLSVPLSGRESLDYWREDIKPNLPWADDHFEERVCGEPLNPGVQWAKWPWGSSANTFRENDKFNHNYMERYWPKHAGNDCYAMAAKPPQRGPDDAICIPNGGIRHAFGDLNDVVSLLVKEPHTRQAYLPIFFPEDTGVGDGGRKPCTLGYQFIMRKGKLSVFYPMRSTDIMRHMPDDIYMTVRLLVWVLDQCRQQDRTWGLVRPGHFTMQMTSLHCFVNDQIALRKELA